MRGFNEKTYKLSGVVPYPLQTFKKMKTREKKMIVSISHSRVY